ncbi:MAG: hypothetical protein IPN17_25180 [Deltaproteobacteria bacterium]|nr:hypothetical protein [Deltaproteobacteria bacterium]
MKKQSMMVLVAAMLGAGCGDLIEDILPSRGSCSTATPRTCTDYTGAAWSAPGTGSQTCTAAGMGATYSSAACSTSGRVGSCVVNSGQSSEVVLRFYPPSTTATAQAACGQQPGSRFVAN